MLISKNLSVTSVFLKELKTWEKKDILKWLESKNVFFGMTPKQKQTELKRIYAKIKPFKTSKRITKSNSKDTTDNGKNSSTKQGIKASKKG